MLIPLADNPNYAERRPVVNWTLIAINVVVFLAAVIAHRGDLAYDAWVARWGFVPGAPRIETLFTSMFMHADLLHLGGNMLFLYIFGDNVEARLGRVGYLLSYLTFGLAAVLINSMLDPHGFIPYLGASGAIFGVCGFYWVAFPRNTVRMFIWLFFILHTPIVRARVVLGAFFLLDGLRLLMAQGMGQRGGVAYAAHLGGFAAGFALALIVLRFLPELVPTRARRFAEYERGGWRGARSQFAADRIGPTLDEGRALVQARRIPEAVRVFESVLVANPGTETGFAAMLQLGMLRARVYGDVEGATRYFLRVARESPSDRQRRIAQVQLEELGFDL